MSRDIALHLFVSGRPGYVRIEQGRLDASLDGIFLPGLAPAAATFLVRRIMAECGLTFAEVFEEPSQL